MERKRSNRRQDKTLNPSGSSSSSKKKFSIRGKRKQKESLTTDILEERSREEDYYYDQNQKSDQAGFSSDGTSVGSALNWSVPNDLPGVVILSSQPNEDNNVQSSMTFPLDGFHREKWASNPDIMKEDRRRRNRRRGDYLDIDTPSSSGPRSCDVAIQVDNMRPMFTFPTPPHSLSPIEGGRRAPISNRVRMLELQQRSLGAGMDMNALGYYTSSNSTLDRLSFPFPLEEESADERQITPIAETVSILCNLNFISSLLFFKAWQWYM